MAAESSLRRRWGLDKIYGVAPPVADPCAPALRQPLSSVLAEIRSLEAQQMFLRAEAYYADARGNQLRSSSSKGLPPHLVAHRY